MLEEVGHKYCPRLNPNSFVTLEHCRVGKIAVGCPLKGQIACCLDCGYYEDCKVACTEPKKDKSNDFI